MEFADTVEVLGKTLDLAGVLVIVGGVLWATANAVLRTAAGARYRRYRRDLGRAILLGLELLVGADIIRTVAVHPSFSSAGVLAIVVGIRTLLSFSLEMELTGRWPWQRDAAESRGAG